MEKPADGILQRTAVKRVDGKWKGVEFKNLKRGDVFQLFEPHGVLVRDSKGNDTFMATGDAYMEAGERLSDGTVVQNIYAINSEPVKEAE